MKVQILCRKFEVKNDDRSKHELRHLLKHFNKKSQFYILTIIILLAFAIGLASSGSKIIKPQNVLFELRNEFSQESPKVVNTAILESNHTTNVTGRYDLFVTNFIDYAKTKNALLDIAYILTYGNVTHIGNKYNEQITAKQGSTNTIISNNQILDLGRTNSVNLTIGSYTYDFEIETGTNIYAVMRKGTELVLI